MSKKDDFYDINDDTFIGEIGKLAEHEEQFMKIIEILKSCAADIPEKNAKLFCRALSASIEAKYEELGKYSYYIGDKEYSSAYFLRRLNKMLTPAEKQMLALFSAKDSGISGIARLAGQSQRYVYKHLRSAMKKLSLFGYRLTGIGKDTMRRTLGGLYGKTPEGVALYEESYLDGFDHDSESVIVEDEAPEYVRADLFLSDFGSKAAIYTFGVGARKMEKGKDLGGYVTVSHCGDTDSVNNDRIELCTDVSKRLDLFSKNGLIIQSEMRRLARYAFAENRFLGTCSVIPASAEYVKCFGYSHFILYECDTSKLADGDIVRTMKLIPIYPDEYEAMRAKLPVSAVRIVSYCGSLIGYIPLDEKRRHFDKEKLRA